MWAEYASLVDEWSTCALIICTWGSYIKGCARHPCITLCCTLWYVLFYMLLLSMNFPWQPQYISFQLSIATQLLKVGPYIQSGNNEVTEKRNLCYIPSNPWSQHYLQSASSFTPSSVRLNRTIDITHQEEALCKWDSTRHQKGSENLKRKMFGPRSLMGEGAYKFWENRSIKISRQK